MLTINATNVTVWLLDPEKLDQIIHNQEKLMSQITDWAATEQADLAAISGTLDGIVTGVAALDTLIQNLETSGGTSAADLQALADVKAASAALVAKAAAISTAPPSNGTPAPAPTPAPSGDA